MLRVPKYALAHRIFVLYCNKTTKKDAESALAFPMRSQCEYWKYQ